MLILGKLSCIYLDPTSDVVMKSVGSNGSLSSPLVMKLKVWHLVSDSCKVMTALIAFYFQSFVVGISLQSHRCIHDGGEGPCWLHLATSSHTYDDAGKWETEHTHRGEAHGVAQLKCKFYPEV
jgi:hypothetical protein